MLCEAVLVVAGAGTAESGVAIERGEMMEGGRGVGRAEGRADHAMEGTGAGVSRAEEAGNKEEW